MNITIENKKQKAIELMNKLDIYKPYIKGFKDKNSVCFYENFGGFWAYQEPELMAKIKEFEEKHNVLVYAVTHEYTEFGECYDFLYISDYEEEWDEMLANCCYNIPEEIKDFIDLERYGRYCGEEYLQEYSDGLIEIQ